MDPVCFSSSSDCPNRRTLEGGFSGTINTPASETLNMQETLRPEPPALPSILEREPLLRDPLSASDVPRKMGPPLHVQFHSQSTPVQASVAGSRAGSSSADAADEEVSTAENRSPDGGWGWVVVFASFMVNLIADGITFSFGVFFPHFLEYFGKGKGKTAWIAGIFMAMPLLSGPISSFLTDRYGCRKMTVLGSLLASLGFVISSFVNNMETLFFTFGILAGFGLSLCYVAAVVIVAYYFDKRRSLATGISVCGSGIGTFVFAPLSYLLLDEYGWRGATLIMAGFFLNMAVCGLLFRDLPWTAKMNEEKARKRRLKREKKRNRRKRASVDSSTHSKSSAAGSTKITYAVDMEMATSSIIPRCSSLVDLPTYMTKGEGVSKEAFELISNKGRAYAMLAQNKFAAVIPARSLSDNGRLHEQLTLKKITSLQDTISPGSLSPMSVPSPVGSDSIENLSQKSIPDALNMSQDPAKEKSAMPLWLKIQAAASRKKPQSFIKDQNVYKQSLIYRRAMVNINRPRPRASSCPNIYRNSTATNETYKEKWCSALWDIWDVIVDVLDFSHFQNTHFLMFSASNFLLYMWYDVPYVYIADNGMMNMGFTESQSSMLISIIGILNMFGEVILGWVGDWECVNPGLIYGGSMMLCGIVTFAMPLLTTYSSVATAAGAFGALISANYSLTSIILVKQITLEKFTNAYGLLLLTQGVANLVGPPLAGFLYDLTNSYDLSFYLAGFFISLSGAILTVLPIKSHIKKRRVRHNNVPTPNNIEAQRNGHTTDDDNSDDNSDDEPDEL